MSRATLLAICLTLSMSAHADEVQIRPFTSDGCSAWPDGTLVQNRLWPRCCTVHDRAYWQGGTYDERVAADRALRVCVASVGEPEVAAIMLAGVRVGGSPWWPTTFRWGYGWEWLRGYRALTPEEKAVIETALSN